MILEVNNGTQVQNGLDSLPSGGGVLLDRPGIHDCDQIVPHWSGTRIYLGKGTTLRFPDIGATSAIDARSVDDFQIIGEGKIVGPSTDTYVAGQNGVLCGGPANGNRRKDILIAVEISNFGDCAVRGSFMDDAKLKGWFHHCGYGGAIFLSCDRVKSKVNVSDIGPGTAGNSYGVAFTFDKDGWQNDPAAHPLCEDPTVTGRFSRIPWQAVDTHGVNGFHGYRIIVRDSASGISLTGSSSFAKAVCGKRNTLVDFDIDAGIYAHTGYGLTLQGGQDVLPGEFDPMPPVTEAMPSEQLIVSRGIIRNFGVPSTSSSGVIRAAVNVQSALISDIILDECAGPGFLYGDGCCDMTVRGLKFLRWTVPGDTTKWCIYGNGAGVGPNSFLGNTANATTDKPDEGHRLGSSVTAKQHLVGSKYDVMTPFNLSATQVTGIDVVPA